jgi:hypothetical protein
VRLLLVAVALLALVPAAGAKPRPVKTYFLDDFSGAAGAAPNRAVWWATPWCSSSADDQEGCYDAANAFLDGAGHLVLRVSQGTMGRPYDFARIQTFREGGWPPPQVFWSHSPPLRVEARIRFAPGAGLWGGFWANGTNVAANILELDMQEFRGAVPTQDHCAAHLWSPHQVLLSTAIDAGADLSAGWHIYWADYYRDHTTFGVDGLTCGSVTTPAQAIGIRLDNVVGVPGTWGGQGGPPPSSAIPADMLVDYVRATSL